ncbi:hypothetical protein ACFPT7_02165 [Acidicapsa dinghuensis]|uniref:Uncharacterized protein n=1 Tax=Acidicapsa dinghuensis TaxID=2218256 RepID=A0ABW1EA23_9BACT|nr:hypothetical protein [Acidicapsa dinghuensis]
MAVTFNGSAVTARAADLIQSAAYEIGAFSPGEAVNPAEALWGLEVLQRIIDQWNAKRGMIYAVSFDLYNLTANHGPHTIGPTGDFDTGPAANYRPVRVASASFVLNPGSTNPVDLPVQMRDKDWWAANPLKSLTSSIITDCYYEPASPNGNLNFFPICNTNGVVRLEQWSSLAQALTLQTQLGLVQGYWEALVATLALALCPSFEKQPSPVLAARQAAAVKTIFENNDPPPRIDTASGMPGTAGTGRPDFNFLTGMRG